jgi:hypothetical protein
MALLLILTALPLTAAAEDHGSVTSYAPLGADAVGMSISGGYAIALPVMTYEVGFGATDTVDIHVRYETVAGLLHFPSVGARWVPFQFGDWHLGFKLGAAYSFFGLKTEDLNLTSTVYLPFEVGMSGAVTKDSDLVIAVGGEVDVAKFVVIEDESDGSSEVRYDASIIRFGFISALTPDLDAFVQGRLRIPIETITDGEHVFFVVPFVEGGATWAF